MLHVPGAEALWEEAEVAEAARELHLRLHEVVVEVAELRLHVALDAVFALDSAAHGVRLREVAGQALEERLPFAAISELRRKGRPLRPVGLTGPREMRPDVVEDLATNADVRNPEPVGSFAALLHGKDAVVVEQGLEVLRLRYRVDRERRLELEGYLAVRRDFLGDGQGVLRRRRVNLVLDVGDRLELRVVRGDVHVDPVLRRPAGLHERIEEVEGHVAVEHALGAALLFREAVAVVPRLDRRDPGGGVAARILADALEVCVEPEALLFREAEHGVEVLVLRDVRGDVEAAR